jgi:hypothetical protein
MKYQITEQFNPEHFIFSGRRDSERIPPEVVAKKYPPKVLRQFRFWITAYLYYLFCGPPSFDPASLGDWIWKIERIQHGKV